MFKLLRPVFFTIVSGFLFLAPDFTYSQISVTSNDVLGLIGKSQTIELDTTGNMAINVGSSGANQTWNFTSLPVAGFRTTQNFVTPAATPFEAEFPMANFVISFTDTSGEEGFREVTVYEYFEVTGSSFANLGGGITIPEMDTSIVTFQAEDVAPLPLAFNASWTSTETDTFGDPATFATVSLDTATNLVDAWGTVQLPIGTFDCLRVRSDNRCTEKTILAGVVTQMSTTSTINYSWISKDGFIVAEAESQDNDTNPNFTTAASFQWVASLTTGVSERKEDEQNPGHFVLFENYPNPFNPSTTISFSLNEPSDIILNIFNIKGQLVRTLASGKFSAGTHSVVWDGRDDNSAQVTSGLYISRFSAGGFVDQQKMLLIK